MWFAISCLIIVILLGLKLAAYNLRELERTKEERIRIRQEYRKKRDGNK
jgi:hypothetical protein